MKAEIISVGTELLLGHVVNTNASFLAQELASLGIDTLWISVVGDNADRLLEAFRLAAGRADIIITSGGLGPTTDDLTRETAARFTRRALVENPECLEDLKKYFGRHELAKNQLKQALIPEGAVVFKNPAGTAPGCAIPFDEGGHLLLLPGPPLELQAMFAEYARPFLATLENSAIISSIVRVFGIGEGAAAAMLGALCEGANPTVATYASNGEMFVKITAKAGSKAEAELAIAPLVKNVRSILGDAVYAIDKDSLEETVVELLRERGLWLATAESCTGGLLAKRITDIPGSSDVFGFGMVAYANAAKEKFLGVSHELLETCGAVSPETAKAMARRIMAAAQSDLGIGITGIAGPGGGTAEKPVGLVYIALAQKNGGVFLRKMTPQGKTQTRSWIRRAASSHALDMIRRHLLNLPI